MFTNIEGLAECVLKDVLEEQKELSQDLSQKDTQYLDDPKDWHNGQKCTHILE